MFDAERATAHVLRLLKDNVLRVSLFHNPGSLLGTMPAFVEGHAVRDDAEPPQFYMARVFVDGQEHAEYVCVCQLAEACGLRPEYE